MEEWIITDDSCNQMMRHIRFNVYEFKEDRIVGYNTAYGEQYPIFEEFKATLDYDDYSMEEIIEACKSFGYSEEQISGWINNEENIPLMLECIFEMLTD